MTVSESKKILNNRLFKLKEWLTVPETVRHLSTMFNEEVSEADILRFALEGHLRLSVYFVNSVPARCGVRLLTFKQWEKEFRSEFPKGLFKHLVPNILNPDEAPSLIIPKTNCFIRFSIKKLQELLKNIQDDAPSKSVQEAYPDIVESMVKTTRERAEIYGGKVLPNFGDLKKQVETINGVWDLPLLGAELLDVRHELQNLTGGSPVTSGDIDGPLVVGKDEEIYQIQERFSDDDIKEMNPSRSEDLLNDIKNFPYYHPRNYYPADTLPADGVLVVRTQALLDLQERLLPKELAVDEDAKTCANLFYLDKQHPFYAKELKIAVRAWTELYENNPPQHVPSGGHKKYITKWLTNNYSSLSQRARERITTIINPNPKGGASPMITSE